MSLIDVFYAAKPEDRICLGSGLSRSVFKLKHVKGIVFKVKRSFYGYDIKREQCYDSRAEIELWNYCKDRPKLVRWLAPIVEYAENGSCIAMIETTPIKDGEIPKSLPKWLQDTHSGNVGRIGRKIVMHDYAVFDRSILK